MRVAACQLPDVRDDVPRAIALVNEYAREAGRRGADLVCFPECFLQGYDPRPERVAELAIDLGSPAFATLLAELEAHEPVIVVGVLERAAGAFYNAAVAISRGQLVARYRKTHLLAGERAIFGVGSGSPVFDVAGIKVGINICHDLNFADSVEHARAVGASVLACPCSNMMPRSKAEEWKLRHNEIRSRRAREQGVWIVSSDITGERDDRISYGPTAVIDPHGTMLTQVPLLEAGMVMAEIG